MENPSVLIVEDQILIAQAIAALLKRRGFVVATICESGEEAIDYCKQATPDLVLMDIGLAGALDGISTASLLQEQAPVPIIYLSDHIDSRTVDRAKKTFPANYLSKPFIEEDLIRHIDIAINNAGGKPKHNKDSLLLRTDSQTYIRLKAEDILYLQADRAYCKIITHADTHTLSKSMNHIAEQFSGDEFMRISRSIVINLARVDGLNGNMIKVGSHQVQMSKDYRERFMQSQKIIK